jgi:hypothetical protein
VIACGDCYGYAVAAARPGDVIVHAKVHDPWSGRVFRHAWIERRGRILDWQSSQGLGPGRRGWTKPKFMTTYRPFAMKRYDIDTARKCMIKERTPGPWRACRHRPR